ncbi:transposase [Lipingzhangella sp. LS1_29]|uniref:Transposase n=1 Tax=Lipingzhangella rawalii TaxID=2055835 RepID=A0ABU2H0G8_9ACTN|nr:transposase [Lipingzhangella rawalii]MDS1268793.1 transposase [Lipingzhangella rawalii]
MDEKSQIQALNRSTPMLPMMPAVPERQTHDDTRAGTTTLPAALDAASDTLIAAQHHRHRAIEFRTFLNQIDRETLPPRRTCTSFWTPTAHTAPITNDWLLAHPRFHLHFIRTYSSRMNLVERFFAKITRRIIRPSTYTSVTKLELALQA